ncbi:hypothetical protein [Brevibacillus porteri]|uniref:Uncharacterized protein n=1 Tax=Brevibacillus porteri TaxID=2126350 RepID=A0ABX5FJG4_9BACL|nr:hypothetical protein [Brevibacillus porteri]MED1802981.1 hypothetical protein [Brevibacillus porteri]MED2134659.1 hypothetical protein [Brevibacillus porteri]MED2748162.1 hypothetical protein [Brevibacillus porteri]MED2817485.1 hypothetical protein [Brevibacillus porteri]MED2897793.1 hypothetical protein [Brevibacillus porteri]
MKLSAAKQLLAELQHYIQLVENYQANTFESKVIYEYALHENVSEVAKIMNELEFRVDDRKVTSSDVSAVLKQKPIDELHQIVSKNFKRNKKLVQKFT